MKAIRPPSSCSPIWQRQANAFFSVILEGTPSLIRLNLNSLAYFYSQKQPITTSKRSLFERPGKPHSPIQWISIRGFALRFEKAHLPLGAALECAAHQRTPPNKSQCEDAAQTHTKEASMARSLQHVEPVRFVFLHWQTHPHKSLRSLSVSYSYESTACSSDLGYKA